jgi:hypothetical protein
MSVSRSSTNVRRSFSCDTALAAERAAKNTSSTSSTYTDSWNSSRPNRAVSPNSGARSNPTVACQTVTPRTASRPIRAAREA